MRRLRLTIAAATLGITLFVGSGVASAGVEWCDWGCPPPFETGKTAPRAGMPTPQFKDSNGKFVTVTVKEGQTAVVPPGVGK